MPQKFNGQIMLRLPGEVLRDLRKIADGQKPPVEAAELLRRAAHAIIECHTLHGEVPMDMELSQRRMLSDSKETLLVAAEEPRTYNPPTEPKRKTGGAGGGTR